MELKKRYDKTSLDKLCEDLTKEIEELSTADDKLKLAYVLMHIIEQSQKALSVIDTENFVTELYDKIKKVCEKCEEQKKALADKFSEDDKVMRKLIDGKNEYYQTLHDDIEGKLEKFDQLIKELASKRDAMKPEQVKSVKETIKNGACRETSHF